MTTKRKNNNDLIIGGLALAAGAYFLLFSGKAEGSGSEAGSFAAPLFPALPGETAPPIDGSTKKTSMMLPSYLPGPYSGAPSGSTSGAFRTTYKPVLYNPVVGGKQLAVQSAPQKKQVVLGPFNRPSTGGL